MVSKSQLKLITGLRLKKYRQQHGLFVVEGIKGIQELISSRFKLENLFCLEGSETYFPKIITVPITVAELKKISFLKTPQQAVAVFKIPKEKQDILVPEGLTLVLDAIRDPGNLGTIIRSCDWFGIDHLVCSPNTVDCYNPKVVQATMGSLGRVEVIYTELNDFLGESDLPIFGAFMNGESIYEKDLPQDAILILGNEANGVSKEVVALVNHRISIPQFGNTTTESLNVAIASALLISEFKRNSPGLT